MTSVVAAVLHEAQRRYRKYSEKRGRGFLLSPRQRYRLRAPFGVLERSLRAVMLFRLWQLRLRKRDVGRRLLIIKVW